MKKQAKEEKPKLVHWSTLKTNPYQQKLSKDMLTLGGLAIKKSVKLKGSTQYDTAEEVYVVYDHDFFLAKIRQLLQHLLDENMTVKEIVDLVGLALKPADKEPKKSARASNTVYLPPDMDSDDSLEVDGLYE